MALICGLGRHAPNLASIKHAKTVLSVSTHRVWPTLIRIPREIVAANVDYSNAYYGADRPQGSRVLYVNGEVDPWHANSILEQPSPGLLTLYVSGASHHAWTHPSAPSDQASVKQARGSIRRVVHNFLADMSIDNHMLFA